MLVFDGVIQGKAQVLNGWLVLLELHELAVSDDVFNWVMAEMGDFRAGAAIKNAHDMNMVRVLEGEMEVFHEDLPAASWSCDAEVLSKILEGTVFSFLWDWPYHAHLFGQF